MQGLYELGARRVTFTGLPPIGCLPLVMTINIRDAFIRQCIDGLNTMAVSYNCKLRSMLSEMKEKELHDAKIAYLDIYTPALDIMKHPNKYGESMHLLEEEGEFGALSPLSVKEGTGEKGEGKNAESVLEKRVNRRDMQSLHSSSSLFLSLSTKKTRTDHTFSSASFRT